MRLLSPSFKSPRGVADVFQAEGVKEKLDNSFSWTDESSSNLKSPAKSPTKKTTKKSVRITSEKGIGEPKDKIKKIKKKKITSPEVVAEKLNSFDNVAKKATTTTKKSKVSISRPKSSTASSSSSEDYILLLKEAIEYTKKRLDEVNEQRKQDAKDIKEHLRKAKQACKEQLEEMYKPIIDSHMKDGMTQKGKQEETANVIAYLKSDNAKIRKEIESYARKIKELNAKNHSLERSNQKAEEAYAELEDHVKTMTAVNEKLNENVTIFKDTFKTMKREYAKRTSHHQCEVNSTGYYDSCIGKIVKTVKDRSKDPGLVEEIYTVFAEGNAEADELRKEHSPNVDIEALPKKGAANGKNKASWSFMCEEETNSDDDLDSDDDDDEE
jgi:DNA repair exonuclease SbcCD ATPase subunit